ncbi:MAG TPA: glutamine-hydrolyzing carbamoyl-phosphate synthase small subunit [Candidatus Sumerlaeota bacterium]|nr:glutamine-hydrolyzing carbamoyl-phosphate synthase small subunit [Candidatus Sumerlaeota bacterium]HOR29552.1 glutamine-hydrolyzing carbamoyl-phosphate synthase small subunit [Candidatus Sumerlaeota bacterium]HPK02697.1 glutamine-hydrolyzing carbamoyl-phosphate synthase small subunit [Candidatus Sumerlaeota bacterium]
MIHRRPPAVLMLADGTRFDGRAFGAQGESSGEVVFNTAMTGYQEILTDPSYRGQMVTLTYPLIGNYGTTSFDEQSDRIQAAALIIKELSGVESNFRSQERIETYLSEAGVIGIEGIDTRELVLKLRTAGAMNGVLSTTDFDDDSLLAKARRAPDMNGLDLVREVTCAQPYRFEPREGYPVVDGPRYRVVAYDFGVKRNILELLCAQNMEVHVVPAGTPPADVLALEPDGIFASNGPGDPAAVTYAIDSLRELIGRKPIFGICLGQQLLGAALGARTFKLKFGHRGANHPVRDERTGRIEITSQNHGFCVDPKTLPADCEITHWNLNDNTLEGFRHTKLPLFAVQYHPEASPGPHDSGYLFPRFRALIEEWTGRG